jgi:hypothetical protein
VPLLPLRTLQRTPAAAALYRYYLYRPVRAHQINIFFIEEESGRKGIVL